MVTRSARLNAFTGSLPTSDMVVEILCENHVGTYLLPYPCRGTGAGYRNERTGELITACVIGCHEALCSPRQHEPERVLK
jgi:hypothetical protein